MIDISQDLEALNGEKDYNYKDAKAFNYIPPGPSSYFHSGYFIMFLLLIILIIILPISSSWCSSLVIELSFEIDRNDDSGSQH